MKRQRLEEESDEEEGEIIEEPSEVNGKRVGSGSDVRYSVGILWV